MKKVVWKWRFSPWLWREERNRCIFAEIFNSNKFNYIVRVKFVFTVSLFFIVMHVFGLKNGWEWMKKLRWHYKLLGLKKDDLWKTISLILFRSILLVESFLDNFEETIPFSNHHQIHSLSTCQQHSVFFKFTQKIKKQKTKKQKILLWWRAPHSRMQHDNISQIWCACPFLDPPIKHINVLSPNCIILVSRPL